MTSWVLCILLGLGGRHYTNPFPLREVRCFVAVNDHIRGMGGGAEDGAHRFVARNNHMVGAGGRAGTWLQSPRLGLKANSFLRGLQMRPRVETTRESLSSQTRGILKS